MTQALEAVALDKRFGTTLPLRGVSFEVAPCETLVVVGPSGCGKTTLLRALAGLEFVDRGRIFVGGVDVTDAPPERRSLAYVSQRLALFEHRDVAWNIGFAPRMQRAHRAEVMRRVEDAARAAQIDHALDRRIPTLSGGERQRVALARALAARPAVLLLDEPFANLDPHLRRDVRRVVRATTKVAGVAAILVSHDHVDAFELGDRVAVMNDGAFVQVGEPRAVFAAPSSTFVAQFFGERPMNMFARGMLADVLQWDERTAWIGVRPQRLRLEREGQISGIVVDVEGGEDCFARVHFGGVEAVCSFVGASPATGETVRAAFDPLDLHRFDARGNALAVVHV